MNAVDTNILIYARDPRDSAKQRTAIELLESLDNGVLLWQVACEYVAASRKLEPFGYDQKQALADISDMRDAWETLLPSWDVMDRAQVLLTNYRLSFWDAMIVAASLGGNVTRLYSEDFDTYSRINGLELVNPFKG